MGKNMTKAKPSTPQSPTPLNVERKDGEREGVAIARAFLKPDFRHGLAATQLQKPFLGQIEQAPGIADYSDAFGDIGNQAASGDLAFVSRMLAAQAITLDNVFAEMTRRMALNMGEYLGPTETYARIALKAQANSRATFEALSKLHQPREQTVRHIHVNEGGQAVIADQFHHHTGGHKNEQPTEQPHAAGTGAAGASAALPSPDPLGNGVPIPCRERKRTVPNARRQRQRGSKG